jgi:hypothetical protein
MEDDLLFTNKFIPLAFDTEGDISKETRRHKVDQYGSRDVKDVSIKLPERRVLEKEARVIISINSNQRNLTKEKDLSDPTEYFNYVSTQNYDQFAELYNLAKNLNRNVLTYDEYMLQNGEQSITPITNVVVRSMVDDLLKADRAFPVNVVDINSELLSLLNDVAVNVSGRADYESMTNLLNAFVMSGSAFNPNNFWRPFYFTGYTNSSQQAIKQIVYNEQLPNKYNITLPRIVDHVKSIRLVSTEIPNTVNNITERNNIITLQLQYYSSKTNLQTGQPFGWLDVPLDPDVSVFNFILVKLDIGAYTVDSLIKHMKQQINSVCQACTYRKYGDVFEITWNPATGVINIESKRSEVRFHLKFYSELTGLVDIVNPGNPTEVIGKTHGVITDYARDLWFLLGFPWPYEIYSDGSNKYTQKLTNQVPFGLHEAFEPNHVNNDIFDRTKGTLDEIYANQSQLAVGKYDSLNTYKPYKYPDVSVKYIYLVLRGYKSINHVNQYNSVVSYKDSDIFAKILLSEGPGVTCYNTFVDNPLIFLNAKDKIETFEVSWVDEQGVLVDFNKADHSFTLEIIHYVTQVEQNGYSTSLGEIDRKSYPDWLAGNN